MGLFAPLRLPLFRRFFLGQGVSQLGDSVFFVALQWQERVRGRVYSLDLLGSFALLPIAIPAAGAGANSSARARRSSSRGSWCSRAARSGSCTVPRAGSLRSSEASPDGLR